MTHGETDEWGHHAVKDIVTHHDFHATVLHLFGLDHSKLVYRRGGISRRDAEAQRDSGARSYSYSGREAQRTG